MAIKSPKTYGDFYWAMQVEAQTAFDETLEKLYAPYFAQILADAPYISELPTGFRALLNSLASPHSAGMGAFALGLGAASGKDALDIALTPMYLRIARSINKGAREKWLTSAEANLLWSRKKIDENLWQSILASEGYEDILGGFLYRSQIPYPSIPELILYSRYHGDPDNVWSTLQGLYNIDPVDFEKWEWLSLQRLTTSELHTLYKRRKIDEGSLSTGLAQMGWDSWDRNMQIELGWSIPNAMLLIQGGLIEGLDNNQLLNDVQLDGIHPDYAQRYFDAVLTKPSTEDVINFQLRRNPELSELAQQLRKIGVHPDYFELYKELAYIIPPVGDIITMAVREAFTPDIAAKFGQYEDLPAAFVEWVGKKGLSKDWASRYWAAHWSLPSPQQGFDMLHRGVITQDELNMLLRALDVMPFWRGKLTQIAYNVLTRVDIRRMYQIGVLTEGDVETSYKEAGYNERDAKRLTEFTVRVTKETLSKFNSGDVISAYVSRQIDESEARNLLSNLGIRSEEIGNILVSANYKKKWEFTDTQTKAIRNLYKRRVYKVEQARSELNKLNLPSEQIEALLAQWYYEIKAEAPQLWTSAQTLGFLKKGIINKARATEEFELLGYTPERISAYLESVTVVTK